MSSDSSIDKHASIARAVVAAFVIGQALPADTLTQVAAQPSPIERQVEVGRDPARQTEIDTIRADDIVVKGQLLRTNNAFSSTTFDNELIKNRRIIEIE